MPIPEHQAQAYIQAIIHDFMASPANDNAMPGGPEPAFAAPLIGFSAASDPIWGSITSQAAPGHWTPLEAFQLAFPNEQAEAGELSVIAWVLPQTPATLADQCQATVHASERWVRNRYRAQPNVVDELARVVIGRLAAEGIAAVSPDFLPEWQWLNDEKVTITSRWSHRHAAFAAGLGTFGLSDGLITEAGKAMRCGSVVARLKIPATPRPYSGYNEYCLYHSSGLCGKCVKRCPCGAITLAGHDKIRCNTYLNAVSIPAIAAAFPDIAGAYGCGLCQAAVPCEHSIPRKKQEATL